MYVLGRIVTLFDIDFGLSSLRTLALVGLVFALIGIRASARSFNSERLERLPVLIIGWFIFFVVGTLFYTALLPKVYSQNTFVNGLFYTFINYEYLILLCAVLSIACFCSSCSGLE